MEQPNKETIRKVMISKHGSLTEKSSDHDIMCIWNALTGPCKAKYLESVKPKGVKSKCQE